ncbi:universal stress protein [Candidatus Villigracilis affinis]|jgi:nucleotide-binding universal stress UspA family protein|uniref:universal stress protein n=1 Tax=Candidatus Villigracilis affinis TaxID=3140682 RepID=UPI001D5EC37A|nr:universal stress protein [Anaerolineales bacterium]MBL0344351.1 universal stress protein [Anaerolineales bacterium]
MTPDLLIATNGFTGTWPSIEYGIWLASNINAKITLLGVNEKLNPAAIDDHNPLEDVFERAIELFKKNQVEYDLLVENGNAEDVIPQKARQGDYIVVLGPLGRPQIRRLLTGRSIRHLMEEIEQPILYVPESKLPLKKILICIGGLGYEVTAEHIAMQMAMKSRAEVTLLHIVPPMDLDYPTARIVRENWKNLTETDTPIGRSLREALSVAKDDGLTASVKARQGNVVEEILSEIKEGGYDLLCMGSPYSTNALRQLYAPNVTAEIAESGNCPVLSARYKRE